MNSSSPTTSADIATFEQIIAEVDDHVLTITLNRPERLNAWTQTMASELMAAFGRLSSIHE